MSDEELMRRALEGLRIESVLDVGTGRSGVYDLWRWERLAKLKCCLDIREIRRDTPRSWQRVYADARCLPFRDGSWDFVQSTEMLEHVDPRDHRAVLRELKRVARVAVYVAASGRGQHRGKEQEELERENPFAEYRGMPSKELLEEEGFEVLLYVPKRRVKAFTPTST